MTAPSATDLPTVADFLADATSRLDATARLLTRRRYEDIDPVAAVQELSRAVAALNGAVHALAAKTPPDPDRTRSQP